MIKHFIILSLVLPFSSPSFAQVHKCVIDGKVTYTAQACPSKSTKAKTMDIANELVATGIPKRWLSGNNGYQQALALSRELDAPIFVYFRTDWCPYCKQLEREVLDTSWARDSMASAIKVRINPEKSVAARALFDRLGGTGYPTTFIQRTADAKPTKVRLMQRNGGSWTTIPKSALAQLLK